MSLVFCALTPHPPLLIPNIGKENIDKLKATQEALEELEKDLYAAQPDTIVIISPHGRVFPDTFVINVFPEATIDFREFGDLATSGRYQTDLNLIADIAHAAQNQGMPLALQSASVLDYGAAVPLFYLLRHLKNTRVVPMSYSLLDYKAHLDFGYFLKEIFMNSTKRIAVVASGDLSHRLSSASPVGFSPLAKKFDEMVLENLKTGNTAGLLSIDQKMCSEAAECGLRSLLILLGILRNVKYKLRILSYESPLGIGYLTAGFELD
ncbi:MAG: AmmeMemoRadiSam system protein B [Candidatus Magasanikbacteria bacterium]|nr:AmmeMemoRadiSam system protein B [Candidatus Magasanikbacteria bacterium]